MLRRRTTLLVTLLLLIVIGFLWIVTRPIEELSDDPGPRETGFGETAGRLPASETGLGSREQSGEGDTASPGSSGVEVPLPGPIDLATADRERDLFGVVVDGQGLPVAGADVQTGHFPQRHLAGFHPRFRWISEEGPSTRTAVDGTFSIRLQPGDVVDLRVVAEGFAQSTLEDCSAGEKVRVVLGEACRLHLRVLDAAGEPISDLPVEIHLFASGDLIPWEPRSRRLTRTTEKGEAFFLDLNPGVAIAYLEHPRGGLHNETVELEEGSQVTKEIVLEEGRTVTGQVLDALTDAPVAGAEIRGFAIQRSGAFTDAEGQYSYGLPHEGGDTSLNVRASGYQGAKRPIPAAGPVDFRLVPGSRVIGTIETVKGVPVVGARITVHGISFVDSGPATDFTTSRSGAGGAFAIEGLHPKVEQYMRIDDPAGRHHRWLDHALAVDGTLDLGTITLLPGRRIEGRALAASGAPLERALVFLAPVLPGREDLALNSIRSIGRILERRTDDLGRFSFLDLVPGVYTLGLRPMGGAVVRRRVTLPADTDLLNEVLRAREGESIVVVVEDEHGGPIEGVYVGATDGYPEVSPQAQTDADGRARLGGLTNKEWRIWLGVTKGYLGGPSRKVIPAGQEIRFVLESASYIRGTVIDNDGHAVPGVLVTSNLDPEQNHWPHAHTRSGGEFSIACRAGAVADLRVAGPINPYLASRSSEPSGPFYVGEVRGISAPAEGVVLRVETDELLHSLRVRVVDPDGNSVTGASVVAVSQTYQLGQENSEATTDTSGRATLHGLPAVRVTVLVRIDPPRHPDCVPIFRQDVVPAGREVDLRLKRGLPVAGVVRDSDGIPVSDAEVYVQVQGERISFANTDEAGKFHLVLPDERLHTLMVVHPQKEAHWGYAEAVKAPASDVVIVVSKH